MKFEFSLSSIKYWVFTLLVLLVSNSILPVHAIDSPQSDYILLLNPDAESCAWGHMLIPTISEELKNKYPDLDVRVEYLYALGITTEEGINEFKDQLFCRYSKPPKYLILLESDSYAILHEDIDARWGNNIPTLLLTRENFIGDLSYYLERKPIPNEERVYLESISASRDNLTVIYNLFDIPGTIHIMKQMFPEMEHLVFVTDNRYISAENRAEVQKTVDAYYPGMVVENLTPDKLTTDELINTFLGIPKSSGILYFTWFNNELTKDKDLVLQTNAYRIFSLYVSSPVFTINDVGLKESGMLGGSYTRYEQVHNTVMNTMDDIIGGRKTNRTIYPPAPIPTFNYLAMLNHNIAMSAIPANTYLYNRPLSFLEKYGNLILGLAIIILISFIFTRIILLMKTRKMQHKEIKLLEKYGDLFNNMPIAYRQEKLLLDERGVPVDYIINEVNPSYEEQLSEREHVVGKKGSEVNPEMLSEILKIYKTILEDKNKRVNLAYYYKATDRYFNIIISPSSASGYMDLFYVDTTELHKTQQLLRTVNSKLMMSLDVANITPWKWDLEKKAIICDVNKPIELYAEGIRDEEQLAIPEERYFARIYEEDQERVKLLLQDLLDGKIQTGKIEYRIYKSASKKSYDWVEVRGAVEKKSPDGQLLSLLGTSLIITDRKNIEQELLYAKEKAEESNRLKSAFLANMSHEIRTPLNAIVGFSNILAATEKEEDKQEYISIIENNNTLLLQLVSDILDLSKIEAGTMEFRYSDVDLNFILKDLQESTQDRTEKGVQVMFENSIPDCYIRTEKTRLLQVMGNMLANAAKFTREGSIRFGYRLNEKEDLYFYVTDTGCGISPQQQEKIFGRFVKLNHFAQGTGLGLSLCQMIVQHLGGQIGVESEEGKGTTFWFTIPYVPVSHVSSSLSEAVSMMEKEKLKVLIAEDNQSNFELFEAILRNDYDIVHAWNGKEAIDLFHEQRPNIVLMDINMPKMNGYEATVELRKISQDVPIIAVTAYAFSNDEKQIKSDGFSGYAPKPLNPQKLKTQMTELLKASVL